MPQPHMNISILQGRIVRRATVDFVGVRRHQMRVRFRIFQDRPYRAGAGVQGHETTVIPCELFGKIAEEWLARVGEGSWLTLEGRLRSYRVTSEKVDVWFVVTRFHILEIVEPDRGYEKRKEMHKPQTQTPITGLPEHGAGD